MSFSSIAAQQREKEQKIGSSLALGFIGSVLLHIVVLSLSSLWVRKPNLAEQKPIELIVVDRPSTQVAKPKPKTKSTVAISSERKSSVQPVKTIAAGTGKGSTKGGTSSISSASSSQSTVSKPEFPPQPPQVISKKPSKPIEAAITQKPITKKQPKLAQSPELVSKSVATLPPKPVEPPELTETLPPIPTQPPEPVQTLKPLTTLAPKPVESSKLVQTPKPASIPTPRLTATPKATLTSEPSVPIVSSPLQRITGNSDRQLNNLQGGRTQETSKRRARSSVTTSSTNRDTKGSSTRDSGQSNRTGTGLNGIGNTSGSGNNGLSVATASGNGYGNGSTTKSGSGNGLACRRCPAPEYPPGAEHLEGRAVVTIDVDKDGNVNDVQIVQSTGQDILDQKVLETVKKKWKFVSSETEQHVRAGISFATQGSDFERQARKREHQAHQEQRRKRERLNGDTQP